MTKKAKTILILVIAVLVIAGGSMAACKILLPYEITANGKTLAIVKNKDTGEKALKKVLMGYIPDDTEIKSVSIDKDIDLKQMGIREAIANKDKVMNTKQAVEYLEDENTDDDVLFEATIKSQVVKKEKYTPEITYKKDDTMLAGDSEVEKEGSEGVRNATYELTSVNGKVESKEVVDEEILEEGTSEVLIKGTLGLPDGEDWQTYEGDPVYNDGADIVTTAEQHLGCPYKYGGHSFVTGIDCVQYVRNIYRMYGIELPNNHPGLRKVGTGVSLKNASKGDIICYHHHVAIYIGNGKMAEATRKKGTKISNVRSGIITVRHVSTKN